MPSISTASISVPYYPNEYSSPYGNDQIVPLYSSVPLKSPVAGCLPCVVCGNSIDRQKVVTKSSQGNIQTSVATYYPVAARLLVVGGGGASTNPNGWDFLIIGGGGGGQVYENLSFGLFSGVTYSAYVGRGGFNWYTPQQIPIMSGEASTFGELNKTPTIVCAGGNSSGCISVTGTNQCGPSNLVIPYNGGGGTAGSGGAGAPKYIPSIGGTVVDGNFVELNSGGNSFFDSNNYYVYTIGGGGGGVGASGTTPTSARGSYPPPPYPATGGFITGGDGSDGFYSLMKDRYFAGGGGGSAYASAYYGLPSKFVLTYGKGGKGGGGSGNAQILNNQGQPIIPDCKTDHPATNQCCPEDNSGSGAGGLAGNQTQSVWGADGVIYLQIPIELYTGQISGPVTESTIVDQLTNRTYVELKFTGPGTYTA